MSKRLDTAIDSTSLMQAGRATIATTIEIFGCHSAMIAVKHAALVADDVVCTVRSGLRCASEELLRDAVTDLCWSGRSRPNLLDLCRVFAPLVIVLEDHKCVVA